MTENGFDKIKKLMKIVGGKVIIIEDGKPTMIIINVDEYVGFEEKGDSEENDYLSDRKLIEKINRNISIWKNKQEERKLKQLEKNNYREVRKGFENLKEKKSSEEIVIEKL